MKSKEMLSVRIPTDMNRALGEKVGPTGISKCQYVLGLIAKDLGWIDEGSMPKKKEAV